jgi:hypothetical protein
MSKAPGKLRIGITLHVREGFQSVWENGIFQNCVFLAQLLQESPAVKRVVLVNGTDTPVASEGMMLAGTGVSMIGLAEALQSLDVVIEMSALLPDEWMAQFRARGGRCAWMRVGNDYVIDMERAMYGKPSASLVSSKTYDAIWTLPQYEKTCKDYFELTTRAPVKFVPHLWTPHFFDRGIAAMTGDAKFGYKPGRPRWRVSSFEPNVCMVKTSLIPMLACEEAYRARPAFLDVMRVLNTLHMKENIQFVHFAGRLDIVRHGMASFEGRHTVFEYLAREADCVVSHQWENAQNYLYYEVLYGGYPLVHNSPLIREYGYYYPDFDAQEAGRTLLRAFDNHDANLPEYRRKAKELLATVDVRLPANVEAYTRELLALYEGG